MFNFKRDNPIKSNYKRYFFRNKPTQYRNKKNTKYRNNNVKEMSDSPTLRGIKHN